MAISVQARKQKGRKLQQKVRDGLLARFPHLTEDDVRSCAMGSQGEDIQLSSAAKADIPYSIEAKARAKIGLVYEAIEQAAGQNDLTPVAVVKADRKDALVVMRLDDWLALIAK